MERVNKMYGKITEIQAQKKNAKRVNVYINDEFAIPCSLELVYQYGLQKGKEIQEENLNAIAEEDNFLKGKSDALRCIEKTHKSEQQVRDKLIAKEYEEKVINRVIEFMKSYNFIDDKRYVQSYIKEKMRTSGRNKIKFALSKKGIAKNIIEDGLETLGENGEREVALMLGEKKLIQLMKSENDRNKLYKKLGDFLVRSGYSFDIVSEVVKNVLKDVIYDVEEKVDETEEDSSKLMELAQKRYNIIIKSEKNDAKVYKKLSDFLLRKGYKWDNIKHIVKSVMIKEDDI
ncbi:MAG: recombination regulator RecX [Clostridiaceae bacterium]|nr:recombination regulator RecX [Clostridiaceae bacterium]